MDREYEAVKIMDQFSLKVREDIDQPLEISPEIRDRMQERINQQMGDALASSLHYGQEQVQLPLIEIPEPEPAEFRIRLAYRNWWY